MQEATQHTPAPSAPPCVMVIFGAGGDLSKRKLIPSLYNLSASGLLPPRFGVVAVDRLEMTSEAFRDRMSEEIRDHVGRGFAEDIWDTLVQRLYYMQGDFKDAASYRGLQDTLADVDREVDAPGNYLFYLATPPSFFGEITHQLGTAGLATETDTRWRRVIIEKPFGNDLDSAKALNRALHETLGEHQIYRIDHYLGKETVQNILVFRFANGIIEPIWNHLHIDHVEITVAESVGVEHRGSYYEEAGVPFYLRTGKRLAAHYTEIAIQYRRAPFVMFRNTPVAHLHPNTMVLRIQPREGIELSFGAKTPGPFMNLGNVEMDFCYADYFGNPPTTGYETLIYDCMNGDATLFKHAENVEAGWEFVQPILDVWHALPPRDFPNYEAGSWGPKAAGGLLKRDGRRWRRITPPPKNRTI